MKNAKWLAKVGLVCLIGISIFLLNGCLYNQQGIDMAYEEGYHDGILVGEDWGYEEGYDKGYAAGKDEGYEQGYERGRSEALEELEPKYYGCLMSLLSEVYSLGDGDYEFGYHVAKTDEGLAGPLFLYNKIKGAYGRLELWDYDIEMEDPAEFTRGYVAYGKYLRDEAYPAWVEYTYSTWEEDEAERIIADWKENWQTRIESLLSVEGDVWGKR